MFRDLEDGTTLFCPQGVFGRKGYVVASTDQEALLRDNLRRYCWGAGGVGMIAGWVLIPFKDQLGFWQSACVLPGLAVVQYIINWLYFRPLTQQMAPVEVPNSPVAQWRLIGQTKSLRRLILDVCIAVGASAFFGIYYAQAREPIILLAGIVPVLWLLTSLFTLSTRWIRYPE